MNPFILHFCEAWKAFLVNDFWIWIYVEVSVWNKSWWNAEQGGMDKQRTDEGDCARSPPEAYAVSCEHRDFRETQGEPQAVEEAVRTALSQVAKPCLPWNT